jgi:ABC-2 type transport system permease protein
VRGILLKGNSIIQLIQELWPMLAFLFVAGFVAVKRYRQTLDCAFEGKLVSNATDF